MGLDHGLLIKRKQRTIGFAAEWRKIDVIHEWFTDRFDLSYSDGHIEFYVPKHTLKKLDNLLDKVLSNPGLAPAIFPLIPYPTELGLPQPEYDKIYFDKLQRVSNDIKKVLAYNDFKNEQIYYYGWW